MYGSETTGRNFSWRATAALLQARARRFSGSTHADRAPGSCLSIQASQDLTGLPPVARNSTDSATAECADVSLDSLAVQRMTALPHDRTSHDYIAAIRSSPASDSSALHTVSNTSSATHQIIPFCHHCGTLLPPKQQQHPHVTWQQPSHGDLSNERRTVSGSFRRSQISQRGPRRVSSSLAGPVQSRAASAGSMPGHADSASTSGIRTRHVSVIAAVSADAASKQLSTFCGLQDLTGRP